MSIVKFIFNGKETMIQCTKEDKMKNICKKYASKIKLDINSLIFLYGGNQLDLELSFQEQACTLDKTKNEMRILVIERVKEDNNRLKCTKCGEIISLEKTIFINFLKFFSNQNDMLNELKSQIELIIKENEKNKVEIQIFFKNINKINDPNIPDCNTIHSGIKCMKCLKEPIVGYRYKCLICPDYNLCQKCEEKNLINEFHSHDFIKFRKIENINKTKIDNNSNNNNIKSNINEENYTYQCKDKLLSVNVYKGSDEAQIKITLINNGNIDWPLETKLIFGNNSPIKGNDIKLNPQKPGEKNEYTIIFNNLKSFSKGEYYSILFFYVNKKLYGEILKIKIVIKEKEKTKNELDKIKKFREEYDLDEKHYTDELLLKVLEENNFNLENAFSSLFVNE